MSEARVVVQPRQNQVAGAEGKVWLASEEGKGVGAPRGRLVEEWNGAAIYRNTIRGSFSAREAGLSRQMATQPAAPGFMRILRWCIWVQILLGSLFATLFLAAVSGIVQHVRFAARPRALENRRASLRGSLATRAFNQLESIATQIILKRLHV
jgi:hypothetical protein